MGNKPAATCEDTRLPSRKRCYDEIHDDVCHEMGSPRWAGKEAQLTNFVTSKEVLGTLLRHAAIVGDEQSVAALALVRNERFTDVCFHPSLAAMAQGPGEEAGDGGHPLVARYLEALAEGQQGRERAPDRDDPLLRPDGLRIEVAPAPEGAAAAAAAAPPRPGLPTAAQRVTEHLRRCIDHNDTAALREHVRTLLCIRLSRTDAAVEAVLQAALEHAVAVGEDAAVQLLMQHGVRLEAVPADVRRDGRHPHLLRAYEESVGEDPLVLALPFSDLRVVPSRAAARADTPRPGTGASTRTADTPRSTPAAAPPPSARTADTPRPNPAAAPPPSARDSMAMPTRRDTVASSIGDPAPIPSARMMSARTDPLPATLSSAASSDSGSMSRDSSRSASPARDVPRPPPLDLGAVSPRERASSPRPMGTTEARTPRSPGAPAARSASSAFSESDSDDDTMSASSAPPPPTTTPGKNNAPFYTSIGGKSKAW